MYGKVNPTGCTERYGLIQVRLDLFLESGDVRYDDPRFYVIDETSKEYLAGYTGKVDKEGVPRDPEAYAAWEASLPRIWLQERCFHHHFIYLDPYTLKDEQITSAMGLHVPNFYKAWTEEWDKVAGGMRHGWDVATRRPRPVRYDVKEPELYAARKAECLSKVSVLSVSDFATQVEGTGETFPSTDIDVGPGATDRASSHTAGAGGTNWYETTNAANATGTIDTLEIWLNVTSSTTYMGTASNSDTSVTRRDYESLGSVASGAKRTFTGLDCDVTEGDGIFVWIVEGAKIERDNSGGSGSFYKVGALFSGTATFTSAGSLVYSLYGTGETGSTAYSETSAVSLGVAAAASRSWGTARTSATALGVATAATKVAGYLRSPSLSLGVAATATRAVTYLRSSAVGLGLAALGAHITGKAITSAVSLGIAATASRTVAWGRSSSVGLGLAATATRNIVVGRASAVALGIAALGAKSHGFFESAALTLGITALGDRTVAFTRTAALSLGAAAAASRNAYTSVTSALSLGVASLGARAATFGRTSAVSLGITALGARAKTNVRTAALSLGITVTAVRDFPHLVYTAIGSIYRAYQAIARIFRTYSADASIERTYQADATIHRTYTADASIERTYTADAKVRK